MWLDLIPGNVLVVENHESYFDPIKSQAFDVIRPLSNLLIITLNIYSDLLTIMSGRLWSYHCLTSLH